MSGIFDQEAVDRLIECMKTNGRVEEAQARAEIARKKLVAAANADPDADLEEAIGEVVAAAEAETRIIARSLQNRTWMRQMRDKIAAEKPDVMAKAEALMGGMKS
jgi:hypothetical protein